jgi:hypothetical protein
VNLFVEMDAVDVAAVVVVDDDETSFFLDVKVLQKIP